MVLLVCLKGEIAEKRPKIKKKKKRLPNYTNYASTCYYPLYSLELALNGKRFYSNDEITAAKERSFDAKDKVFHTHIIEKQEKCWNDYIVVNEDYVDE